MSAIGASKGLRSPCGQRCKLPGPSKSSRYASGSTRDLGLNAGGMACISNFTCRPLKPQFYFLPALCRGHKTPARATRGGKMKRFPLALLALAVALAITPAALADSFNYTYTDGTLTATGTLSGNLVAPGEYDITSGTISITGGGAVQGSGGFLLRTQTVPVVLPQTQPSQEVVRILHTTTCCSRVLTRNSTATACSSTLTESLLTYGATVLITMRYSRATGLLMMAAERALSLPSPRL